MFVLVLLCFFVTCCLRWPSVVNMAVGVSQVGHGKMLCLLQYEGVK